MGVASPQGWARFAWQSDYGQFYLVDCGDVAFEAPVEITPQMEQTGVATPKAGLVVYTQGCLQQHIQIAIYASEPEGSPVEPLSGRPWTRVSTATASFPSRAFGLSSPSFPHPLPAGPLFVLDAERVNVRIEWMEHPEGRDDSVPVEPDVIAVTLWPA
ncbi:hypothetical protein ACFQ4O_00545 [Methylopila musalis]|uniref:Uncharacterized protein n=1 Tax=Methylopila musalis TaxID=1134781 RepID=A0ABW3Z2U1_9HYPH